MNEDIFHKYTTPREKKIIYSPRNGEEMMDATLHQVPVYKYSELCDIAKKLSPSRMLGHLFRRSDENIILLQDPSNMDSGHWLSVSRNAPKHEIYFFSTYGGKPDIEKIRWMNEDDLRESGQFMNIFNDSMRELQKHGWEIHYNDFPYQKPGDKTAVCGIYTAAFLRSKVNPDEFEKQTIEIAKSGKNPAVFYYDKYFR